MDDYCRDFIIDGIMRGFQIIPSDSKLQPGAITNYKSATASDVCDKVETQIREEIQNGNYLLMQTKPTIVSALGAIPKPNKDKRRLLYDCSRPQHYHVNSYTRAQHFSYVTIERAVSHIKPKLILPKLTSRVPIAMCHVQTAWPGNFREINMFRTCTILNSLLELPNLWKFSTD